MDMEMEMDMDMDMGPRQSIGQGGQHYMDTDDICASLGMRIYVACADHVYGH